MTFFVRKMSFFFVKKAAVVKAPLHMIIFIRVVYKTIKIAMWGHLAILTTFGHLRVHSRHNLAIYMSRLTGSATLKKHEKRGLRGVPNDPIWPPFEQYMSSTRGRTCAALKSHPEPGQPDVMAYHSHSTCVCECMQPCTRLSLPGVEVGYNAQGCTDLQIRWKRGFWPFLALLRYLRYLRWIELPA